MGREIRKVVANWQHPKNSEGRYVRLQNGADLPSHIREWDEQAAKWVVGLRRDYNGEWIQVEDKFKGKTFAEWYEDRPDPSDYMPVWAETESTHFMMYENTSEGTPISPAFPTLEKMAQWLAENGASAFGESTANYESWLTICREGCSIGAAYTPETGLVDGVTASTSVP